MPTQPRRRWFQFSISTMLWLMLMVALAAYGERERGERQRFAAEVARQSAEIEQLKTKLARKSPNMRAFGIDAGITADEASAANWMWHPQPRKAPNK